MPSFGLVADAARIFIGGMFVLAAIAKLRDGFGWIRQASDMGVWPRVAAIVPWLELLLGSVLIVGLFERWSMAAAGLLLLAFTAIIVRRIADGSRPPCACFGARSERPLGARDVTRNIGLLALVLIALAGT